MKNALLITILLATSLSAFAAGNLEKALPSKLRNHLTISSVELKDVTSFYPETSLTESQDGPGGLLGQLNGAGAYLDAADVIVDKVINIGTKIWNVVEKGHPVANFSQFSANALPEKALRWNQLQNWKSPTSKVYAAIYKNLYGMEVVRFVYRINVLYGGDVGGIGRYIGYTNIEPVEMTTAYLYNFDAQAKVSATYNMGSSASPVAGMMLNVTWTVKTILKSSTESHTFVIDGLGNIRPQ
ncbi:MAG: hypothetical protein ACXWQQ_09240 [Pseudobdellovibrio sp.]